MNYQDTTPKTTAKAVERQYTMKTILKHSTDHGKSSARHSILLFSFLASALLPLLSSAQVNYDVDGAVAYVAESPNASGNIVITPTYNGYPVVYIGNSAFNNCSNLTGVTIPNSITNIGNDAFYACTNLMNVAFGNSVVGIGDNAFSGCQRLTNIAIPDSVTGMGWFAFGFCTGLTSVTIGDGITGQWGAFGVFTGCTSLRNMTLGSGVNYIEGWEFQELPSLTNITVVTANPVYSSLDGVLFDKTQTTLIAFPEGRSGSYVVPDGVITVGADAFAYCSSLTSLTIPGSVTALVYYGSFDGCVSLTNFTVAGENATYSSTNGVLFNKAQTTLHVYPAGRAGSYVIPNGVINVGSTAFSGCPRLTGVTVPNSVINLYAGFDSCPSLTNITVAETNPNFSSINGVLFNKVQTILLTYPEGRTGSYIIPAGVTVIGYRAFSICTNLTSVTIPNTVTNLMTHAFVYCPTLTNLTFEGNAPSVEDFALSSLPASAKAYYYYGTIGWPAMFGSYFGDKLPTVMLLAHPQVSTVSAGAQAGGIGFTITDSVNQVIVVEASTNLVNWQPIWTNILSGGSTIFTDPHWTNYPNRFYRVGGHVSLLLIPNLSGASGSQTNFVVTVPAGKASLQISTSGGTGDCDLYVRFGVPPTLSTWDYRPYLQGNNESVTISNPAEGNWYVMVHGYENYSGVTLRAK